MPVKRESSRNLQLTREWRLLRELQASPGGRSYTELARSLGAAPRTVYRDLKTLQRAGFPIERAKLSAKQVWRMSAGTAPAIRFSAQELAALAMARQMLLGIPGSPFDGAMRQAFHKIQSACDREGERMLLIADRRLYADLRRARPYTQRQIWFRMLLSAVFRQRTVRIKYFTLERGKESLREVDPYALVYHEGAFYLVGRCHWRKTVRTFLLDRIRAVSETPGTFVPPGDFSARDHFRQSWGLLKGRALTDVKVRFSPKVARVIKEGRWHESQKIEEGPGGSAVLRVRVAGWEEIKRWILSFGSLAEVLEPAELRDELAREAGSLRRTYAKGRRRAGRGDAAAAGN